MLRPDPCVARRLIFIGLPEPSLLSSPDSFFSFPSEKKSHLLNPGTRNSYLLHLLHLSILEDTLNRPVSPSRMTQKLEIEEIKEYTLQPLAGPWALESSCPKPPLAPERRYS